MKAYIHYGSDTIDKDHVYPSKWKEAIFKPSGFWGCPVDSKENWKEWCIGNQYDATNFSKSVTFALTNDARVLVVTKTEDILPYVIMDSKCSKSYSEKGINGLGSVHSGITLNRLKLEKHFDAIELIHGDKYEELHLNPGLFYSWDVDSIVVWRLDKVTELTNSASKAKRRIRVCK